MIAEQWSDHLIKSDTIEIITYSAKSICLNNEVICTYRANHGSFKYIQYEIHLNVEGFKRRLISERAIQKMSCKEGSLQHIYPIVIPKQSQIQCSLRN